MLHVGFFSPQNFLQITALDVYMYIVHRDVLQLLKKSQIEIYSVYTKLINVCNELINELMKKINARFI